MPSLTWHIVKKDYRYLRPYLDIWWGILLCNAVAAAWCIHHIFHTNAQDALNATPRTILGNNQTVAVLIGLNWFFLVLDVTFLCFVVDAILKIDSPIDEKAFWRTRPVGGARMFRAKFISLGLFCFVVPGVIQAAGHLVFGFSPGEFLRGLAQFAAIQGGLVALVACAAVLFQRTIQGMLTFVCLAVVFIAVEAFSQAPDSLFVALFAEFRNAWIFPGLFCATALMVAVLIYTGHRRLFGSLALVCGILLMWSAGFSWMNDQAAIAQIFASTPARDEAVKLAVAPSPVADQPSYPASFPPVVFWRLHGWITNPALPELKDSAWRIRSVDSQLSWPGTKSIKANYNPILYWNESPPLINSPAAFTAMGYGRLVGQFAESWRNIPLGMIEPDNLTRLKKEPAKLAAQFQVESGQFERLADLPTASGSTWHTDMITTRVESVALSSPTAITVRLDQIGPWHSRLFETETEIASRGLLNPDTFLLYNPKTRECVEGTASEADMDGDPVFNWQRATVTFSFDHQTDATGQPVPDAVNKDSLAQWLADARLVEFRFAPTRSFIVPVTIDQFLLPTKFPVVATPTQN
jgi:hypothetical protein